MKELTLLLCLMSAGYAGGLTMLSDQQPAESQATVRVLQAIHQANQRDVVMGQLAQEKGTTLQVRSLGETLVRDHHNVDEAVVQVAHREGCSLTPPHGSTSEQVKKLKTLSGTNFDTVFAQTVIQNNQKDRSLLINAQSAPISGEALKLVLSMMPTLDKHLTWAESIHRG